MGELKRMPGFSAVEAGVWGRSLTGAATTERSIPTVESVLEAAAMPEERPEVQENPVCAMCRDTGWVQGVVGLKACECRRLTQAAWRVRRAEVPQRYVEASFASFVTEWSNPVTGRLEGIDPSIQKAVSLCKATVENLLVGGRDAGLLLCGTCGVGKTHLAAATLRAAMETYGMQGQFWEMTDLLLKLKRGFAEVEEASESEVARRFAEVEALVVDELGGERLTDWSFGEVQLLLSGRYNAGGRGRPRLTVFTTNYRPLDVGQGERGEETLGDRIGARMFSRVMEICRVIPMMGQDWRKGGRNG